jgi:2-dehydropantoate 2-reductase
MIKHPLKIGIAGAGAIGCTLAAKLAKAGADVSVFTRGETLNAIQKDGVSVTDLDGHHQANVTASDCAKTLGPQDWILICTKALALPKISQSIQDMITPNTHIIPFVNGIPWWYWERYSKTLLPSTQPTFKPFAGVSKRLPKDQLLCAVTYITAHTDTLGRSVSSTPHEVILGEINGKDSHRLQTIASLFQQAGINTQTTLNIEQPMWAKVIANLTSNPLSAITGATLEQIYSDPNLVAIVSELYFEARKVASSLGVNILPTLNQLLDIGRSKGPIKTSMLQDLEQQKPLELITIGDAVVALAQQQQIATPAIERILAVARFISAHPNTPIMKRPSFQQSTLRSGL